MFTYKRLTQVYQSSEEVPFNDNSKFILFSDCHRGDNSWADDFARNENLYYYALEYYYRQGFTYFELGDGDELWKNRKFADIREAHSQVFELLVKFHREDRLYMLFGNHDMVKSGKRFVKHNINVYFDEQTRHRTPFFQDLKVHEGLILKHEDTGDEIFLVHGHQGDLLNDQLWWLARFLVRYIWRQLEMLSFKDPTSPAKNYSRKGTIERNIIQWIKCNHPMVIAGHTHHPMFPEEGQPAYFNSGSCVHPYGITGIEIDCGKIALIRWSIKPNHQGALCIDKNVLAGPKKLTSFFRKEI